MTKPQESHKDYLIVEFDPKTLKVMSQYVFNRNSVQEIKQKLEHLLDPGPYNVSSIEMSLHWPTYIPVGLLVNEGHPTRFLMVSGRGLKSMQQSIRKYLSTYSSESLSVEEARRRFLNHIFSLIEYWNTLKSDKSDLKERLSGLAFSIMSTLDGSVLTEPGYHLVPMVTKEDADYADRLGERHYAPTDHLDLSEYDIAGGLHETFHRAEEDYAADIEWIKSLRENDQKQNLEPDESLESMIMSLRH